MKRFAGILCAVVCSVALSACGGGSPSQSEITKYVKAEMLNGAVQSQSMFGTVAVSDEKKQQLKDQIDNKVKISSTSCKEVEGFDSVYDCKINLMVADSPLVVLYRFTRKKDGTLSGHERTGLEQQ